MKIWIEIVICILFLNFLCKFFSIFIFLGYEYEIKLICREIYFFIKIRERFICLSFNIIVILYSRILYLKRIKF